MDEALAVAGEDLAEADLAGADGRVGLVGNVAAEHVVEEDAEGPDGHRAGVVAAAPDPLRRRVDTGS